MAGYIGSKSSVTLVDGYSEAEADAEFVNDPNGAITVSGSNNVGIGTTSPASPTGFGSSGILHLKAGTGNDCSIVLEGLSGSGGRQEIGASGGALQFYRGAATGSMTESMRIDSSGNVGIGNTSSGYIFASTEKRLSVGDGTQHAGIQVLSGTNKWGGLEFADDTTNVHAQGLISYYHPLNYMQFNTGGSERMRIDASGNVTTPYQPAFFASSSGADINISSTTATNFNVTRVNVGNNYSTSTKRFTAPVSGTYYFECVIQVDAVSTGSQVHALGVGLLKNGTRFKDQYHGNSGTTNYITVNCNAMIYLNQSDYVTSQIQPGTSIDIEYSGGTDRCHFSGYLIG